MIRLINWIAGKFGYFPYDDVLEESKREMAITLIQNYEWKNIPSEARFWIEQIFELS